MKSQALICNEEQEFSLEAFEIPPLAPADLLVRCTYSGVSVGTEFAVFRRKLDYGPFPVCTGYQAVGIVEAVGSDVTRFEVGDKAQFHAHVDRRSARNDLFRRPRLLHCFAAGCGD